MPTPVADPGVGREDAPIGSIEWAQGVRLHVQFLVDHIAFEPESLHRYIETIKKHRAWTLLNKPDGTFFKTFDEFCEFRKPWGLGKKWDEIRPFIEAALGKKVVQLATVAPDGRRDNRRGGKDDSHHDDENQTKATDSRLRAILRAPAEVQELYREGLISQTVAAKLGPKKPDEAMAHRIIDVVVALREAPRERKAIDAKVREVIGERAPDVVDDILRRIAKLSSAQQARLRKQVCGC